MKRLATTLLILMITAQLRAEDYTITHFDEKDGLNECQIGHIIQDRDGLVWIASWDGLKMYDGYRFHTFKARPGDGIPLGTSRIDQVQDTGRGFILCWAGNKCYLFNKRTLAFSRYSHHYKRRKLTNSTDAVRDRVSAIERYAGIDFHIRMIDRQQGIWVSSNLGLDRLTFRRPLIGPRKFGDGREEEIRGLYADRNGRIWICDKNGHVMVTDADGSHIRYLTVDGSYSEKRISFGANVYVIQQDHNGYIWLGTKYKGLYLLTPQAGGWLVHHFRHCANDPHSISGMSVYSLIEDYRHRLWVGTFDAGLNLVDQSNGRIRFLHSGNTPGAFPRAATSIRCMAVVRRDVLMIGTSSGIYTCRLSDPLRKMRFFLNVRNPYKATSLSNDNVRSICTARDGAIYVATYGGGLNQVVGGNLLSSDIRFRNQNIESGMLSDDNLAIINDCQGTLWVVSENALCSIRRGVITRYTNGFFRNDIRFTEASPLLLTNGDLVMGTTCGILHFNPDSIHKSSFVPKIRLSVPDKVELRPEERNLRIGFTAIDFNRNESILYAYRMEGIDKEWHYTTEHEINYANLPSGTRRFTVKSTNGDGVWVNNDTTVTINRRPYFNETIWARILYSVLLAAALILSYNVTNYIRHLQKEIKDIRLTTNEKMEIMRIHLRDMLSIHENITGIKPEKELSNDQDRIFADRARAFVKSNLNSPDLCVKDFAQEMGVSRTLLYARMKSIFNCSPITFILNHRIERACQLLRTSSLTISEISYQCGFADPKYFCKCFKKIVETTPTEFRLSTINTQKDVKQRAFSNNNPYICKQS